MRDSLVPAKTAVPALFFLSGAAALIYQSLWMRQLSLVFGNTTHSVTVTLAAFMGGIALGSHLIARRPVRNPARLYALAEAGAGITALTTLFLLRGLPRWYGGLALPAPLEAGLLVASTALVIGPTTVLLGLTFPLLAEFLSRAGGAMHAGIGALYRANTLGGAAGVLLAGFLLLPALGVTGLFLAAAATNLAIGGLFWILMPASLPEAPPPAKAAGHAQRGPRDPRGLPGGAVAFQAPAWRGLFPLLAFAGEAPGNTDDRPLLELNAPKGLYRATNSREQRLAMYATLAAVGRDPLPPLRNHPAVDYERLAALYEAWLQPDRARRLAEAVRGLR